MDVLTLGIELGTSRTEGYALTKCAPPFPPEDEVDMF